MELKENKFDRHYLRGKAVITVSETDSVLSELNAIEKACILIPERLPDELKHLKAHHDGCDISVQRKITEGGKQEYDIAFGYELMH